MQPGWQENAGRFRFIGERAFREGEEFNPLECEMITKHHS